MHPLLADLVIAGFLFIICGVLDRRHSDLKDNADALLKDYNTDADRLGAPSAYVPLLARSRTLELRASAYDQWSTIALVAALGFLLAAVVEVF